MKTPKTIYMTETDQERLERLIATSPSSATVDLLEGEIARATILPSAEIPGDIVTMNSQVRFKDMATGEESDVTLVYPRDADFSAGRISVLAPVGAALLGLRVGDEIEWPLPSGKTKAMKIVSVLFQPEAAGQFHL